MKAVRMMFILLAFLVFAEACGSDKASAYKDRPKNGSITYVVADTLIGSISDGELARDIKMESSGKSLFYAVMDDDENTYVKKLEIDNDLLKEETCIKEKGYYLGYSLNAESIVVLLLNSANDLEINSYKNGEKSGTLSVKTGSFEDGYPFYVHVGADSECVLACRNALYLCNSVGEVIKEYACPGTFFLNAVNSNDSELIVSYAKDDGKSAIASFDITEGLFCNEIELNYSPLFLCNDKRGCLISDGDTVELYSNDSKETIPIFMLSRKSISRETVKGIIPTDSGFAVLSRDINYSPDIVRVAFLQETDEEVPLYSEEYDEEGRRIIYVYSHQSAEYARGLLGETADGFMFENPEYSIRFMDADTTVDFVLDKKYNPDILCELAPYKIIEYGEKGYLEDLWPYIKGSERMANEEINAIIPECYAIEDKLYGITDAFSIMGLMVSDAPKEAGVNWTVNDFLEWIEENPDVRSIGGIRQYVMTSIL